MDSALEGESCGLCAITYFCTSTISTVSPHTVIAGDRGMQTSAELLQQPKVSWKYTILMFKRPAPTQYINLLTSIFAIDEINNDPDILPNVTLGYHVYDTCGDEKRAIQSVLQILSGNASEVPNYSCQEQGKVAGFIGDLKSSTTISMAQILSMYGYTQISYGATDPLLSDKALYPYFLRTVQDDLVFYASISKLLQYFGWNWVGIITTEDESGEKELNELRQELTRHEICIEFVIKMSKSLPSNLKSMTVIEKSTTRVVIICVFKNDCFMTTFYTKQEDTSVNVFPFTYSPARSYRNLWLCQSQPGGAWLGLLSQTRDLELLSFRKMKRMIYSSLGNNLNSHQKLNFNGFQPIYCNSGSSRLSNIVIIRVDYPLPYLCESSLRQMIEIKRLIIQLFNLRSEPCPFNVRAWRGSNMCAYVEARGRAALRSASGRLPQSSGGPSQICFTNNLLEYRLTKNIDVSTLLNISKYTNHGPDLNLGLQAPGLKKWLSDIDFCIHFSKVLIWTVLNRSMSQCQGPQSQVLPQQEIVPHANPILGFQNDRLQLYIAYSSEINNHKVAGCSLKTWKERRILEIDAQITQSRCTDRCPPGYRKASGEGYHICCYQCVPCSEGEMSNVTDSDNCQRCPDNEWPDESKVKCIPKTYDFLSYEEDIIVSVSYSVSIVFAILTFAILGIFILFRNTPIVRANNWNLTFILLVSIILSFLCVFLFLGRPVDITCMLRQSTFGLIFSVAVSCILAKTIIVCIAFKATKPGSLWRRWVGVNVSNFVVLICTSVQVLINVIWLSISPPFQEFDMHSYPGKIIIQCNEGSVIAFYCVLGYMGILASMSFVLAFMVRTLPDSFNEAKYITFSMLVFCSVWIAMIPAYLSTKGKYMVAVEIFAILASSAGILGCIFFPKCYILLIKPEMNTKQNLLGVRVYSQ
ncbi:vomeronasal type-2 receptor 26-like [Pelobates cultripes]|uniref:Vomeronasal type-2 receptor 26-like n=1 Tax=Pelobates cultripes TaxID=61616 RepID=A0AAD1SD04_PELCU|nr:vomeronasal type-2 receptor 26-like [Pelobates cultripes]